MSKDSAYFTLNSISQSHDIKKLKRELDAIRGVISVSVNAQKNSLAVDYDSSGVNTEQLTEKISNLGYEIRNKKIEKHIM